MFVKPFFFFFPFSKIKKKKMQVERSRSFLDHLICIQQEQRAVLYSFAKQLELFRQRLGHLTNLSTVPITSDQLVTLKFMRQQKVSFTLDQAKIFVHVPYLMATHVIFLFHFAGTI